MLALFALLLSTGSRRDGGRPGWFLVLAWDAKGIAEARAQFGGFYVDAAEVDAWIDSIGAIHELPPPPTRRR